MTSERKACAALITIAPASNAFPANAMVMRLTSRLESAVRLCVARRDVELSHGRQATDERLFGASLSAGDACPPERTRSHDLATPSSVPTVHLSAHHSHVISNCFCARSACCVLAQLSFPAACPLTRRAGGEQKVRPLCSRRSLSECRVVRRSRSIHVTAVAMYGITSHSASYREITNV